MFFKWIRNIAAILLFPLLGLSSYFYYQTTSLKSQPNEQLETTTAYGVKTKITLSDGSEVWLNSGSTLSYPQHFTGDKRQVQLSGEAFFKVKSDKKHRFDVRTKDDILTSSSCHPKIFVKEFSYFLMPCHQHCLGVNLLVQR